MTSHDPQVSSHVPWIRQTAASMGEKLEDCSAPAEASYEDGYDEADYDEEDYDDYYPYEYGSGTNLKAD